MCSCLLYRHPHYSLVAAGYRVATIRYRYNHASPSSSSATRNHYEVLGVSPGCDEQQIRESYIRLSKELHPDRQTEGVKTHDKFVELQSAYEVLSKPSSRIAYDTTIGHFGTYRRQDPGEWRFRQDFDNQGNPTQPPYWRYDLRYGNSFGQRLYRRGSRAPPIFVHQHTPSIITRMFLLMMILTFIYPMFLFSANQPRHHGLTEMYIREMALERQRQLEHRGKRRYGREVEK